MRLPNLPYDIKTHKSEIIAMRGINYSDRLQDGDLRETKNLSARRWPYIATRRAREKQTSHESASAMTAWGALVTVTGTDLRYDGQIVGRVSEGEKQFAVVNTKLIVWPDKIYLDLSDLTVRPLNATITSKEGETVTFTDSSITMIPNEIAKGAVSSVEWNYYGGNPDTENRDFITVYDRSGISFSDGEWTLENGSEYSANDLWTSGGTELIGKCAMIVDGSAYILSRKTEHYRNGELSDTTEEGTPSSEGNFAIITAVSTSEQSWAGNLRRIVTIRFTVAANGEYLEQFFSAGDAVTLEGEGITKKENIIVRSVTGNTVTFDAGVLDAAEITSPVTIRRDVPDMDYICESENRLWGCSSETRTIYASALGLPGTFHAFEGLSTDSFSVAVGTDGPFTGCCKHSSSVLFWKETKLHKVLGSYPAEYVLYTYELEGLREGSHKSLQVINDTLYYLGIHGVYAYTGASPVLISDVFGQRTFSNGVAGTDGDSYFLSVSDGEEYHLLVYELRAGIWLHEDNTHVVDFARLGTGLYFLTDSGEIWLADTHEEDPNVEWTAQFAPFYETIQGRKSYSRMLLRLELPIGSYITAEVRTDGGRWNECGKAVGAEHDVVPLRISVNRCDRFEIRLRGRGPCTILSLLREFSVVSTV